MRGTRDRMALLPPGGVHRRCVKTDQIVTRSPAMPALPPTHFWRLTEGAFHIDRLQLRRKVLWFSTRVDDALIPFYRVRDGVRVGVNDPTSVVEAAARDLHFVFETGKPQYLSPRSYIACAGFPHGMSLDEFEGTFDAEYRSLRRDYR